MVRRRFFSAVSNHESNHPILRDATKRSLLRMRGALTAARKHTCNIAPDRRRLYRKTKTSWEAEVRANRSPGRLEATSIPLLCIALVAATHAAAQKRGGTLRLYHNDNPPSTSLLEESTIASVTPFAAVFNNLVVFDPSKPHESLDTVIPDLAESWSWDSTNTRLTFKLRQGVKWHDGKPFTASDVQCTWRMLIGKGDVADFHRNPRRVWYSKLQDVSVNGDYEATFELSEPQPQPAGAARKRFFGCLSVPRSASDDAHQAGRYRAVQIRRVQARRLHPSCAQS